MSGFGGLAVRVQGAGFGAPMAETRCVRDPGTGIK